ncbi:MAG: UTP--glucose-1-phosphate uridylyltransferase, partial [Halorubrum sp.]
SGRTIDAIRLDGWRIDVGYPEDRDRAAERLSESAGADAADDAAEETVVED